MQKSNGTTNGNDNENKINNERDPLNSVIIVGFFMIGLVLVFLITLITDTNGIRTSLKNRAIEVLLQDRIQEITLEIEGKYNQMVMETFDAEKRNLENEAQRIEKEKAELEKVKSEIGGIKTEWEEKVADANEKQVEIYGTAQNVAELSSIYAKMDAKKAAAILSAMEDDDLAVLILFNMKETESAAILGEMDKVYAASMTRKRVNSGVAPNHETKNGF